MNGLRGSFYRAVKNDAGHHEVIISSEMKVVGLDLKGNGRFDCNSQPETALFA